MKLEIKQSRIKTTIELIKTSSIRINVYLSYYQYAELIEEKLGLTINKEDEMECMIRGCNFLLG